MEKKKVCQWDPIWILILFAHIGLPLSVAGLTNGTDNIGRNVTLSHLDNTSQIYENTYYKKERNFDGGDENRTLLLNHSVRTNTTSETSEGFIHQAELKGPSFNSSAHQKISNKKQFISREDKNVSVRQKNPTPMVINNTVPGTDLINTSKTDVSNSAQQQTDIHNRSHWSISESIYNYVTQKGQNSTLSKGKEESSESSVQENNSTPLYLTEGDEYNASSVSSLEYTDYDYETEQSEGYGWTGSSTVGPEPQDTSRDLTTGSKLHVRAFTKHTRHGLIWQNNHYIRSVIVPVGCGIIGALALVCVAYALRSCPTRNLYINDEETFKVVDEPVCVNDRLMLLVDSSDEEV